MLRSPILAKKTYIVLVDTLIIGLIKKRFGTLLQHEHFHLKLCKCNLSYDPVATGLSYHSSNINAPLGERMSVAKHTNVKRRDASHMLNKKNHSEPAWRKNMLH